MIAATLTAAGIAVAAWYFVFDPEIMPEPPFSWETFGTPPLDMPEIRTVAAISHAGDNNAAPFPDAYLAALNEERLPAVADGRGYGPGEPEGARVLLIGIDGATWKS
ncbi:MAG: hypothetical protein M5R36_18430 [Deltaproteobacteria bacterium]|nr:hypothetical protein [Deltaproteobacteria bacterium]